MNIKLHVCTQLMTNRKRELIALLNLSSWCLVMVERLFLAMPRGCLQFVIVVFPDYTHLLFLSEHAIFIGCVYCMRKDKLDKWWTAAPKKSGKRIPQK